MYKLIVLVVLALGLNASNLLLKDGEIKAHTEVFGDSEINPMTKDIRSSLSMHQDIQSIRGIVSIASISLKSQKRARDKNMYELLHSTVYPIILFRIRGIQKRNNNYQISGTLTLNGITKEVTSFAHIESVDINNTLNIQGTFDIKLSNFNMTPPTMFFLTIRDQIDISYNLLYKKDNK